MNDEFKDFKKVIQMERSPYSNYLVYQVNNRNQYKNWCKAFCTPVLYKKIKKEGVNIDPSSDKTDFSKIDKYVIAYGKSISSFNENSISYIDFETYLPIQYEGFAKLGNNFIDNLMINAPYDDRFKYDNGDIVLFKFNDFIFRFQVDIAESYAGILYQLNLKYVDKKNINDLIFESSEPTISNEEEYW